MIHDLLGLALFVARIGSLLYTEVEEKKKQEKEFRKN